MKQKPGLNEAYAFGENWLYTRSYVLNSLIDFLLKLVDVYSLINLIRPSNLNKLNIL